MDQILQPAKPWTIYKNGRIADRLAADVKYRVKLDIEIARIKQTVFSADSLEQEVIPYVEALLKQVNVVRTRVGRPPASAEEVKAQLRTIPSTIR